MSQITPQHQSHCCLYVFAECNSDMCITYRSTAGCCEMQVNLSGAANSDEFGHLFAEELGLVVEVSQVDEQQVLQAYTQAGLTAHAIGHVTTDAQISISVQDKQQISGRLSTFGLLRSCRSWQPQSPRQSQCCCHCNGTCLISSCLSICKRLGVEASCVWTSLSATG